MDFIFVAFLVCMIFAAISISGRLRAIEESARRMERKADVLMAHLGLTVLTDSALAEVDDLLREGHRTTAIQRYRELTGAGQSEAREALESREAWGR